MDIWEYQKQRVTSKTVFLENRVIGRHTIIDLPIGSTIYQMQKQLA